MGHAPLGMIVAEASSFANWPTDVTAYS